MTLLLKQLFAFVKLLNSETGTNQIAAGVAVGLILGFSPMLSLQTLLVFAILFVFRIQIGAAFLCAFFFKFIAYLGDPAFHWIGQQVLTMESLTPFFTTLYNLPLVPLTRFNNSIVMGSGLFGLLISPFVFVISRKLIEQYREQVVRRLTGTKTWKAIQATSLYKWYAKYDELYN